MPNYKNEKTKTWYCSFYYTDWTGKRKKKKKEGFRTQKEAKEYEAEFLAKTKTGNDMTFQTLYELYMNDCENRVKPTTYENKKYIIDLKILPYFSKKLISEIDIGTVRTWQNELLKNVNNYSPTYLKVINNQLTAMFNYGMKFQGLPRNTARDCGSIGKKKSDKVQFWTENEFKIFIKNVENKEISKTLFNLLFYTGLRVGEALALTLEDFNFEEKTISITKSFTRHLGKDLIQKPKTPKSKRIVFIPSFLSELVKEYIEKLYDYRPNERLFLVTKHYLLHEIRRGIKETQLKRIRTHDLRHSHASYLIELGISIYVISERLGHENIKTTLDTYSHLYPNKQEEVADKLQEIFMKEKRG